MDNICQIPNEAASFCQQNDQEQKKQALQQLQLKSELQTKNEKQMIMIEKKFDYQLIEQSSYVQNEFCGAIAFNKNATIMIAGSDKLINVFEFKDCQLKEVQQLNGHSGDVYCLQFMKKSNQFISGSQDSTIIIWNQNINNLWQIHQVLQEHKSLIYCIALNQNEDILISGSHDDTIKFWQQSNDFWNSYQQIDCQSNVESISLSEFQDKLIASLNDKQILVITLEEGKVWMIKQKISVNQFGFRLCFINQDQFVFQPYKGNHLQIFDYDQNDQIFKQVQQLEYSNKGLEGSSLFPIRHISEIGLIMVKHDIHVNLIKKDQNGQFKIEQSINFDTNSIYGGITDDGRYIVTWDDDSNEVQIRKFDY